MTLPAILRAAAIVFAVTGVVDPVWHVQSIQPRPVDFRSSHIPDRSDGESQVKARLQALLGREATFESSAAPIARVVVTANDGAAAPGGTIPTSFVSGNSSPQPNVGIVSAEDPPDAIVGWKNTVAATIEGHGVSGSTATVVLQQNGTEISRVQHKWTRAEERAVVHLPYVAPAEGAARLSIRVVPLEGERDVLDNRADVRMLSRERRFRILVHEPRPSWAAAFVRRVLEENRAFDVASFAGASKGLAVRTGGAPVRLGPEIDAFDAIIVAAPEELSRSDVEALNRFARNRGGSVLLLPDRRPSGPYLSLLGSPDYDEVLVEKPIAATASAGAIRASELVLPRREPADADVLATIERGGQKRSIVYGWPAGLGRVIFSGALDAWRFRATGEQEFNRFWTAIVAGASLAAPMRLEIRIDPGACRPGETIAVHARVRDSSADSSQTISVRARLISASGEETPVRLWPGAEPDAFEGDIVVDSPGAYDLHVASGEISADTVVVVADDVRRPVEARDRYRAIAAATAGVVATPDDLAPLAESIRALPAPTASREIWPARNIWFAIVFAALLCAEWTMRRRSGLR